jgi:hypothetical protein
MSKETTVVSLDDLMSGKPIEVKSEENVVEDGLGDEVKKEDEVTEEVETTEEVEDTGIELDDEKVLSYLRGKGKEVESLDALFSDKTDSISDLLDDDDKDYLEFKRQTGGSRKDYEASKIDYDSLDRKDVLRDQVRGQVGFEISDEDLDELIEDKFGIPMGADEGEMSIKERFELYERTNAYIESKKSEQSKLKVKKTDKVDEKVKLEDGREVLKSEYDKMIADRNQYLDSNKDSVNRVSESSLSIGIDIGDGNKVEVEAVYKFDKDDKHRMLESTNDLGRYINENFTTDKGYNHDSLNENMAWFDPKIRAKMLNTLVESAWSQGADYMLGKKGNVNLTSSKSLPKQAQKGVKIVPLNELMNN